MVLPENSVTRAAGKRQHRTAQIVMMNLLLRSLRNVQRCADHRLQKESSLPAGLCVVEHRRVRRCIRSPRPSLKSELRMRSLLRFLAGIIMTTAQLQYARPTLQARTTMGSARSLDATRNVSCRHNAKGLNLVGNIRRKRNLKRNWCSRKQRATRILIGDPDDLSAAVIERANHVRDVDD